MPQQNKQVRNAISTSSDVQNLGLLQRIALSVTVWTERWFPDAFVFTALAVVAIALGALVIGASPKAVMVSFGTGFWSLINFTMQMTIIVIIGYVVATSPPVKKIHRCVSVGTQNRPGRRHLCGIGEHGVLIAQLGVEPHVCRPAGEIVSAARRSKNGLSRRRRRRLFGRGLGVGVGH